MIILEEKIKFLINSAYFFVCGVILFLIFKLATVYLLPFIIGVFIAYIVQKPAKTLAKKTIFKKETCAAVLSVVFYCITIMVIVLLLLLIYNCCNGIIVAFLNNGNFLNNFKANFDNIFSKFTAFNNEAFRRFLYETIVNVFSKISNLLTNGIASFIKKIPTLFFSSVITIVATCYMSKDFDRLNKFLKGFISERTYEKIVKIKDSFFDCFLRFTKGYIWIYLITFFELLVGFILLKIPNFLVLSFIVSLVDLLPVFGTGVVLLPWSVVDFLQSNYKQGFGLIILYLAIMVIRNFAEPKIIGKQININPIFTLLFIFIGLRVGGIIGMLFFPLLLTAVFNYYRNEFSDL